MKELLAKVKKHIEEAVSFEVEVSTIFGDVVIAPKTGQLTYDEMYRLSIYIENNLKVGFLAPKLQILQSGRVGRNTFLGLRIPMMIIEKKI